MNIKLNLFKYILALSFLSILFSCDQDKVFDENKQIEQMKWHKDDKITFEAEINDTTNLHNIHVNVRNSVDYKYVNFYMFLDTELPDGRVIRDTLECLIADRRGEWTGDGFGKIRSNQFLMREKVWFPKKGKYTFHFQQAMREDSLEGISDIGLRIERH